MNAHPLAIRLATPADGPAIAALIAGLAHLCTAHPDGRGAERFFSGISPAAILSFIESPRYRYLVGELNGKLAGVIAMRDNSHLFHLFVDARHQASGLASLLWLDLKAHALASGNPGEFTVNSSMGAVPVYQRFGFATLGGAVEEDGLRYVRMRYPGVATYIAEGSDS